MAMSSEDLLVRRTGWAVIAIRLLSTPCWCLLSLLAFILYKNLHLSALQITTIVALKPASSLLSPYWCQAIYQRPDRIIKNLIGANVIRHLPFLFIPWISSPWLIIVSFGLYMMLTRATIPAWMELYKYNLPKKRQEEVVSYGTMIDYLGAAVLIVGFGILLDHNQESWKWLFPLSALLGLLSTFLLMPLSTRHAALSLSPQVFKMKEKDLLRNSLGLEKRAIFKHICCKILRAYGDIRSRNFAAKMLKRAVLTNRWNYARGLITIPWKQVWELISTRRDFTIFQVGFMLGGAGLMIMQPALPQFFIDTLQLSFTEMGVAIALCKAIGVTLTTPLWTRLFRRSNIFQLSALVTLFAAVFPFLLLATSYHLILLYLAYMVYGMMQAGSELSWHMSGLVFAGEKESSTYSVTNVLTVGMRGCVVPAVGSMLLAFIHPLGVILSGAVLCLLASGHFLFYSRKSYVFSKERN